jgi:cell division protein FtsI/penicillin-binding protein 2
MTTVLAKSLNVGAAQVAVMLGKERFYTYVRRFGFGRITEVDLDSEGPGTLKTPGDADWHESDLGTNSFGQGIAVTPLQMTMAVAAVANDGLLMKPYMVQQIQEDDRTLWVQPTVVRRAVLSQTARTLTDMLAVAVQQETELAQVPGYRVAGKTGTAQIPVPGGYHPTLTVASFAGYLPADDPAFVILVVINKPRTSPWGNQVAAPVFANIAKQLVVLFDVPPDNVRLARSGN